MSSSKPKKTKAKRAVHGRTKKHPHHHHDAHHHHHHHALFGTPAKGKKPSVKDALIEVGKYVLFVAGGGILGATIGKPSLYLGLPVAVYAFYKKHHLLGAAAVAAMFTPVVVTSTTGTSGYDDMEGFDIKKFEADAKARLQSYFSSIAEKTYFLPKPKTQTTPTIQLQPVTGLNGGEEVSYFLNPNNMGEAPDMSSLDKISEQVAKLAAGGNSNISGFDEPEFNM